MHPIAILAGIVTGAFVASLTDDALQEETPAKPVAKKKKKKVAKSVPITDNSPVPQLKAQDEQTDPESDSSDASSGSDPETG